MTAAYHDKSRAKLRAGAGPISRADACLPLGSRFGDSGELKEALRASEECFRELAGHIREIFWMTDPARSRMLYVSPAYETISGRTCASLYANPRSWLDAVHPAERERVRHAIVTKQSRGDYDETYRIVRSDGTERWIHDRAYPVTGPDGVVRRIVGVAEDITEYRALEEQLHRRQRVEAIGALASGIAHDLNNILAPVLIVPSLLRECTRSEHDRELLRLIERSARRGSNVVRQLLTFSRGSGGERTCVQLSHLLKEMTDLMQATFPRNIVFDTETVRDLWPVCGDPTQLYQVILNLCVNARDAMPNGGKLSLTASNAELSEADAKAHAFAKAGPHVTLSVTDTGHGMSPEILARIFDSFFTTKASGKGTGLGLATVQGIVRSHDGFVTVSSVPDRGTTFTIHLPVSPEVASTPAEREPVALPCGHDELVLVVDDEASICQAMRLLLEKHRYRVLTASHGREALEIFRANRSSVSLVLTDLMMPLMDGVELVRALRTMAPQLKMIVTSGLKDQGESAELKIAGVTCLTKPSSPRELLEAIAQQLACRT